MQLKGRFVQLGSTKTAVKEKLLLCRTQGRGQIKQRRTKKRKRKKAEKHSGSRGKRHKQKGEKG